MENKECNLKLDDDFINLQQKCIDSIAHNLSNDLDQKIKIALASKGHKFETETELFEFAKKNCKVVIRDGIHTLFANKEPVCKWSYNTYPIDYNLKENGISINTYIYFEKL